MQKQEAIKILWDYMQLKQTPEKADCIIGFGCYNEDVARCCAQLYHAGLADRILFTGGLGRNTSHMWIESEAERFARIAAAEGVPEECILQENASTNSGENLIFSRRLLRELGVPCEKILGVHKPYMERRLFAAFPVYWPEAQVTVTSWQQSYEDYIAGLYRWNRSEEDTVHMLAGDFQRVIRYAKLGYQVPQPIPQEAMDAFTYLVSLGYTAQLVK